MATSSILGGDRVPTAPSGTDMASLGPSNSSDSGSDSVGALGPEELDSDSDAGGTGERASVDPLMAGNGFDILPDHLVDEAVAVDRSAWASDEEVDREVSQAYGPLEDIEGLIDTPADVQNLAVEGTSQMWTEESLDEAGEESGEEFAQGAQGAGRPDGAAGRRTRPRTSPTPSTASSAGVQGLTNSTFHQSGKSARTSARPKRSSMR
jgi:hypothetical protein